MEAMYFVSKGKDPAAEKKAERSEGTFEELATRYIEEYAKKKNKSWTQADKILKCHVLPRLGKLKASEITRADINSMHSRIEVPSPPINLSPIPALSLAGR